MPLALPGVVELGLPEDGALQTVITSFIPTMVESPDRVANLIRRALEYIPADGLVITTDCGFGREGLSRRIAQYKMLSLVQGTNLVRRELGLPEAYIPLADAKYTFSGE